MTPESKIEFLETERQKFQQAVEDDLKKIALIKQNVKFNEKMVKEYQSYIDQLKKDQ